MTMFDPSVIDSLKMTVDTVISEIPGQPNFYTAEYYVGIEDSTVTKVLRDSSRRVTAIIQSKHRVQFFIAEYYPNSQIKGKLSLVNGKVEGPCRYYYSNGRLRSRGSWKNGKQVGIWKEYNRDGELREIISYSDRGVVINIKKFGEK
jgi:antitoxin component YwqK of YwqJK toxin-antitoxin module